jgi:hypothetical protein
MFIAIPTLSEASAPLISSQQQTDLDCLSVGGAIKGLSKGSRHNVDAERLVRVYLGRLQRSDRSRDWKSLVTPPSAMRYGWFMGQIGECRAHLKGSSKATAAPAETKASLRVVDGEMAELQIQIQDGPSGYRLVIDCVRGCSGPIRYSQDISDTPIGLFKLWDGDNLVYSIWAGGSAYRVRAWSVSGHGVSQVLEASSRGRPDFLSGADGEPTIRTYEAEGGTQSRQPALWQYREGKFSRAQNRAP